MEVGNIGRLSGITNRTIVKEYLRRQIARCVLSLPKYFRWLKTIPQGGMFFGSEVAKFKKMTEWLTLKKNTKGGASPKQTR
jgi:hypothetical protein